VKTIYTKVTDDMSPARRQHAVWLLRNGLRVHLALAVAGQVEALMMVPVEVTGCFEFPVIPTPQVEGLDNSIW